MLKQHKYGKFHCGAISPLKQFSGTSIMHTQLPHYIALNWYLGGIKNGVRGLSPVL